MNGLRVSKDGVIAGDRIVIDTIGGYNSKQKKISTAFNGADYFVAYQRESGAICGKRVSGSGTVLDAQAIPIDSGKNLFDVSYDGENYLVLYGTNKSLSIRKIGAGGAAGEKFDVLNHTSFIESPVLCSGKNAASLIACIEYADSLSRKRLKVFPFPANPVHIGAGREPANGARECVSYDPVRKSVVINAQAPRIRPGRAAVAVRVFDSRGRAVRSIDRQLMGNGRNERIRLTGSGENDLPRGVYIVHVRIGEYSISKNLILFE